MEGYVFPNELHVIWGLTIVVYPYITGLVAGAFIVSSLYHVFNVAPLKVVARFSLLTALAFLLICALPLLLHLGRPERSYEMFLTPNPTSAMAGFGYIWATYTILVLLENWFSFRKDIVEKERHSRGLKRLFYRILSLGSETTEGSLEADHRMVNVLAAVGIPMACILHGYVGFLFGGVKANPWWSTPLMPLIFLMSAIVSGIALLIVLYVVTCRIRKVKIDAACIQSLVGWLIGFLIIDFTLEALELISMYYEWEESWEVISHLLAHKLKLSFFYIQFGMGTLLPLAGLTLAIATGDNMKWKVGLATGSSICVLVGVLFMRFNVVIGGQLFSKSLKGFIHFDLPFFGREGIMILTCVMAIPLILLTVFCWLLPPWPEEPSAETFPMPFERGEPL
jgi:Ni/Fe-hydrogenase subunit HybB-like protein